MGPRARRARLTKSGAAPCGRATGDPGNHRASGRDPGPGSDLTRLALSAPAGLSPGLGGLGVPFSRRTRLPLARAAPAEGKPQLRALGDSGRRPPGLQVRGRDRRDARACQPVFPLLRATRARARPPRAIKHAPRRRCHRAPGAIRQEPASSPAPRAQRLTLGAGGGEDQRAAAAKAAATAAAGRAPVWSTEEGSAAEPRGAAPTMAEPRHRAPRPPPPAP